MLSMKEFHEIANLFPLLAEESIEFRGMVESVKKVGLLEAITLLDDKILDGRNRERASEKAGLESKYEQYIGNDPFGFVAAKNLHRRHLTTAQLAFIAAELVTIQHGGDRKSYQASNSRLDRKTNAKAAKDLGIGETSVQTARRIKKDGIPEVVAAAKAGKVTLNAADDVSKLSKEEQPKALESAIAKKRKSKGSGPKANHQPLARKTNHQPPRNMRPLKELGLTPEQVDPELADNPFEFARRYGHVNLFTKDQIKEDREKTVFGQWIGVIKDLKRPLEELLKIPEFSEARLEAWLNRTSDPVKYAERLAWLQRILNTIEQAAESVTKHIKWLSEKQPK